MADYVKLVRKLFRQELFTYPNAHAIDDGPLGDDQEHPDPSVLPETQCIYVYVTQMDNNFQYPPFVPQQSGGQIPQVPVVYKERARAKLHTTIQNGEGIALLDSHGHLLPIGTLAAVVRDLATGETLFLSCNHVIANYNNALLDDAIVRASDSQVIGRLRKYHPLLIGSGYNIADCALASPMVNPGSENSFRCSQVKATDYAIGLYVGGDSTYGVCTPIAYVESVLGVECIMPKKDAVVGMSVFLCGEVSTPGDPLNDSRGSIRSIDYDFRTEPDPVSLQELTFIGQIVTDKIGREGDSGALLVEDL